MKKGQIISKRTSERTRAEETLARQANELARSNAELAAKNKELDSFAHTISHDLKEPLRAVEAFSQFLLEDYSQRLDAQGRDYLTRLAQAGARMKRLIDDLMTLSEMSRASDAPTRVALGPLISGIVEELRFSAEEEGTTIQVQDGLPDGVADPLRINQIFHNLIGNALKFNESDEPLVKVGVRGAENGMATLYVQDNGLGIDPRYHERIFGMFQRLHRREEYEGTGAGLTIVKHAVEAAGGQVWLESDLGAGTTFFFTLPAGAKAAARGERKTA